MDSVSVWGLSGRSSSLPAMDISKQLDSKVDKYGSEMYGVLNMNNKTIQNVGMPINNSDCATKLYSDNSFLRLYDEIAEGVSYNVALVRQDMQAFLNLKGGVMAGNIDMKLNFVKNIAFPLGDLDAVNKIYLKIASQRDEISVENLFKLAEHVLQKIPENLVTYRSLLDQVYTRAKSIMNIFFKLEGVELIPEFMNYAYITELKVIIIFIIEEVINEEFLIFTTALINDDLIITYDRTGFITECCRIVEKFVGFCNPDRKNLELDLLRQKNLLLINLGFMYFSDTLLEKCVIH